MVPSHKLPPTAIGRPDLHGIPQLVRQVIRADAIWEALRQQHGSEARKSGQCCPEPPASTRVLPGFRCLGLGEPTPVPSPVPLQAPIGRSAAAARGSGAELLSAQRRPQARSVSHPQAQRLCPTRQKARQTTFPVWLRWPQRSNSLLLS